jgi:hypothetical protein
MRMASVSAQPTVFSDASAIGWLQPAPVAVSASFTDLSAPLLGDCEALMGAAILVCIGLGDYESCAHHVHQYHHPESLVP